MITSTRRATYLDVLLILTRSEEHTSELQSRLQLVCRLLLEKKKTPQKKNKKTRKQETSTRHHTS